MVNVAMQTLRKLDHGSLQSRDIGRLRRLRPQYQALTRVQIVNGSLFVTFPRREDQATCSGCLENIVESLTLLLSIARFPDVDFLVDVGENSCHKTFGPKVHTKPERAHGPVAIFATETEDGCDNVLIPPRAYDSIPDNARWAAHASDAEGAWAWHRRMNKAVFRGATTGPRLFDAKTGAPRAPRAIAVALSLRRPKLLDARFASRGGFGGAGSSALDATLREKGMSDAEGGFMTWHEALRYRAALVIDGNTVPDRLAFILASSTAVLKVKSRRREAYHSKMRPYVHYVPVKADASNLESQLVWALANATRLRGIARNGATLALTHLSRRATLCHWTSLLLRYHDYMAGPIELDQDAVRIRERPPAALPHVIDPVRRGNALRPQLSHSPRPWLSDLNNLLRLHTTPCVGLSWRYLCVDITRRRA